MLWIERMMAGFINGLFDLFDMTQEDVERVKARETSMRAVAFNPGADDWSPTTEAPSEPKGSRQIVVRFGR